MTHKHSLFLFFILTCVFTIASRGVESKVQYVETGIEYCPDDIKSSIGKYPPSAPKKEKKKSNTKVTKKESISTTKSLSSEVQMHPFVKRFDKVALDEEKIFKVPYEINMAQAILETGWGDAANKIRPIYDTNGKKIGNRPGYNYFGIHVKPKEGDKSNYFIADDGAKLRAYNSPWESWRDHSKFLHRKPYAQCEPCKAITNREKMVKCWLAGLEKGGYCEKNAYDGLLLSIIDRNHLWQ